HRRRNEGRDPEALEQMVPDSPARQVGMEEMTRLTKKIKLPLALAAAGIAALAAPGVAGASTVSVSNSVLTYTAAPSEANHVTVSYDWHGYYVVQDSGVPSITASGTGCSSSGPQLVYCA